APGGRRGPALLPGAPGRPCSAIGFAVLAPPDTPAATLRVTLATTPATLAATPDRALERMLRHLTSDVGFVGLAEGDTVPADRVSIRVKGEAGVPFRLWPNGEPIPPSRAGRHLQLPAAPP